MVKVVQNIPGLLVYLPPQLSVSSQVCSYSQRSRSFQRVHPDCFPESPLRFHVLYSLWVQLNQSGSGVAGLVELLSGRRRLWALGELSAIDSGYRQAVELKHSYPQVFLGRNVSS